VQSRKEAHTMPRVGALTMSHIVAKGYVDAVQSHSVHRCVSVTVVKVESESRSGIPWMLHPQAAEVEPVAFGEF